MEEPVPCGCNNSQHGAALCHFVHSILHGQCHVFHFAVFENLSYLFLGTVPNNATELG